METALKTSKIIENLENYAKSDILNFNSTIESDENSRYVRYPDSDEEFWKDALNLSFSYLNYTFIFRDVCLSEWVSRVPGLYYKNESKFLNKLAESQVEYVSDRWTHFTPSGKSQKVMAGTGTLNIPPDPNGWYIGSISTTNNASTGIPVLIKNEVWNYYRLKEGTKLLKCQGKWISMSSTWAVRFDSIQDIPKAYLIIDKIENINVEKHTLYPTIYHPYTIMEYETNGGKFYDFVYATVDSSEIGYRENIRNFFNEYKDSKDRYGQYLIEPCIVNPILDETVYKSPEELRSVIGDSSHLKLLKARITNDMFQGKTIEDIKIAIDNYISMDELIRYSETIKINPNSWNSGKSVQDESASLIAICLKRNKLEVLVDLLVNNHKEILN